MSKLVLECTNCNFSSTMDIHCEGYAIEYCPACGTEVDDTEIDQVMEEYDE